MKVADLGEFGLIDRLAQMAYRALDRETEAGQQLILGIGDDAAAWYGDTAIQLATVDSLIQGIDFTPEITSWEELGWKAMAANLSDIAAMGGLPKYALVSLALPGDTEVDNVVALYRGMIELAQRFKVALVGGDTSGAPLLMINITILGSAGSRDKPILTRSAARSGEKVAVTGYLGAAAAGLEMLTRHRILDAESAASLRQAFLKPYPRVVEGQILVEHRVRAAIDISDGLVADLRHICQASQVGARVEIDRLPIAPAVRANFGERAPELALAGGEDYELLFTASQEVIDKVTAATSCPITIIGETTVDEAGEVILLDGKGQPVNLPRVGWEHFTAR